jgi:hypothetical protein
MRASIFSLFNIVALISLFSAVGLAAEKPGAKDKEKPKFPNEVVSVDDKSITIVQYGTKEKKFTVTEATKVTLDYKPAKIGDVKMGMKATVSHKAAATPGGEEEATSISAQTVKAKKGKG